MEEKTTQGISGKERIPILYILQVSDDAIGALKEYGINPALWTEKDKYVSELTA